MLVVQLPIDVNLLLLHLISDPLNSLIGLTYLPSLRWSDLLNLSVVLTYLILLLFSHTFSRCRLSKHFCPKCTFVHFH